MAEEEAVDMTMQGEEEEKEEEKEEAEEDIIDVDGTEQEKEDQDVVEVDGDEQKQEEEDEVQFMGSVEGANGHPEHSEEEEDVVLLETGEDSPQERSNANTNALMAANGFVTAATLEAELQCIICQYAMFKPVSVLCGHSFCRVCLMDSFLTRPIEEAQCPICRVAILQPFSAKLSLESIFSINVTLWNLVQLLIPSVAERVTSYQEEEEGEFKAKLDQLDAKWKILTLSERAAIYHGDHDDEDEPSGRPGSPRWEEDHEGHDEYPVVKVDHIDDGNLHVSRNVVLDTNDENEDGYINMRVGLAIVEFPSIFELYNEHQECSVNVIKMEEDEEMTDGMPFFMNEEGDDDGFVCSSYFNEISLRVCDEAGNCVMERTRGAQGGVVTFPGLRLDVPGGVYTFRFADDLYGLKLSITTRLREPHEISDTPVADYVTLIHDEARDASRHGRDLHDSDDEGEFEEEGNESEDSFIVDDLSGGRHEEEPVGHFSDEGEDQWEYHSDDEAADDQRENRRIRRRQRSGRHSDRDVQFVDEHPAEEELSGDEGDHDDPNEPDDADEHEEEDEVRPGRRNVRVVEETAFSSDGEPGEDAQESVAVAGDDEEEGKEEEEHHETRENARPRRRNANQIVDSEDEHDGSPTGLDEEQKEDDTSDGAQDEHTENAVDEDGVDVNEDADEKNEDDAVEPPSRKVNRAQWFQQGESEEEDEPSEFDVAFLPGDEDEAQRPLKRARGTDRQVRIVDEGESDEERELMERSIAVANSMHPPDEDAEEDADNSHSRHVHDFYDEDVSQDDGGHDYPDEDEEENDYPHEQDDYAEFSE